MGLLNQVIKTAVISTLGAKLARGRSPIVAALLTLLATRMLTNSDSPASASQSQGGLGDLVERFRNGGLEDIIKSWIGTGPNKPIAPSQLQHALGSDTVDDLSRESGMPRDDLLAQLSKLLPDVVDRLTPHGQLPPASDLLPGPTENEEAQPRDGRTAI